MSPEVNYKAELVGVFGHPVAENPTIVMQEAGFRELGLNWRYLNIEVYPQGLADAMQGLRAMNMQGINLTIPHKVEVLKYLDEVAGDAKLMGAVNTVRREGDRLIGENTDGKGFLRALRDDAQIDPVGQRVVILGAGGAARAIGVELALAQAAHITIVNRTVQRGQDLTTLISENTPAQADFVVWDGPYTVPAETNILVNATSIGLYPDITAKPDLDYDTITAGMVVCDVIPNPPHTPFLREAEARGARALDGLGMLVYQGAIAFKMWTGFDAPVEVMHRALAEVFTT
ncbi:MAG: shikimate dehydrogenase [Anaerolineae bacterium]|nr:shikimate dehydrogenase [Anaerolineae bacterium]MCB0225081.1 shikimate dehydrogenase [Anaerolineae bacterium]